MKRVVLLLVAICAMYACKKPGDKPYCWVCYTLDPADTSAGYEFDTLCNTKEAQIKKLEADSTAIGLETRCYVQQDK